MISIRNHLLFMFVPLYKDVFDIVHKETVIQLKFTIVVFFDRNNFKSVLTSN